MLIMTYWIDFMTDLLIGPKNTDLAYTWSFFFSLEMPDLGHEYVCVVLVHNQIISPMPRAHILFFPLK